MKIIAREKEKQILEERYSSHRSELIALYGRRRVGKTYLIRNFFKEKKCIYFEIVGQKGEHGESAPIQHQLNNFQYAWKKAFNVSTTKLSSWDEAFAQLKDKIDSLQTSGKTVVMFFDELPWLCTTNSRFYENFDQAWNTCFEPAGNVKIVVCGSASTWILKKIIYAKAGLSRRVTLRIHLKPFTVKETARFLKYKGFSLIPESVVETYMLLGGIPYYLDFLSTKKSLYQNIDDECFNKDGNLFNEYGIVFESLFRNSKNYMKTIECISKKRSGSSFEEIHTELNSKENFPASTLMQVLKNLYECDFINKRTQLFNEKKGILYFVSDEFIIFYLKWIRTYEHKLESHGIFSQAISNSQSYTVWLGFSFESFCLKHHYEVRKGLGLHKIAAIPGMFYSYDANTKKRNTQIDLLFDRADKTITLCEIKYHNRDYTITKKDYDTLQTKKNLLEDYLATKRVRRNILMAFITLHGVKRNSWFNALQPDVVSIKDFFY